MKEVKPINILKAKNREELNTKRMLGDSKTR